MSPTGSAENAARWRHAEVLVGVSRAEGGAFCRAGVAIRTGALGAVLAAAALLLWCAPAGAALVTANNDAQALANAISGQDFLVTGASWTAGPSSARAVGTAGPTGKYFPTDGNDFAVLTTGDVANVDPPNNSPSKGTNNNNSARNVHDLSILKVDLNVPAGRNCVSFDLAYYSEEFPEFVGSRYNDAFIGELDANSWTYDSSTNAVTAPANIAFDESGRQLTINSALAGDSDTQLQFDRSTSLLRARSPVTAGAHSLYFTIYDAGDNIYDSAIFLDNIRTATVPAGQCVAGAKAADSDGDALPDDWEQNGVDVDGDGTIDLDLPAMGADPQHKDLFVEGDYMRGHQPPQAAIDTVITSFRNAPVTNPDGNNGIELHYDNGSNSPMRSDGTTWGTLSQSGQFAVRNVLGSFDAAGDYNWAAFDVIKQSNFQSAREPVFRYVLWIRRFGSATTDWSGIARVDDQRSRFSASDFLVSLGRVRLGVWSNGVAGAQAGTVMHELGHTLGLHHGGDDDFNRKPNYLSIMAYGKQFPGVPLADGTTTYDYSRFDATSMPNIDETSLSEPTGVVANGDAANYQVLYYCGNTAQPLVNMNTAIDFDCDNATGGTVAASINADATQDVLVSKDDWAGLQYQGGSVGGFGLDATLPQTSTLVDTVSIKQLQKEARVVLGDSARPRLRVKVRGRGARKRKVTIKARDDQAIDQIIVKVSGRRTQIQKIAQGNRRVLTLTYNVKRGKTVRALAFDRAGNASRTVRKKVRRR